MPIIFDLDQTLVDSSTAESHRNQRNWKKVMQLIPEFRVFDGIKNIFDYAKTNKIKIAVVTSSPKMYCEGILKHFGLEADVVIGYHDTVKKKPAPDPILLAVKQCDESGKETISIGDLPKDIIASNLSSVISVAALWGSNDADLLKQSNPKITVESPQALLGLIEGMKDKL